MFEQGLSMLVQANPAVAAIAKTGGWPTDLPKGTQLPSWSYFIASDGEQYTLRGRAGLSSMLVQIDCYGADAASAILLAEAIDNLLSGFRGVLPDAHCTQIDSCFRQNKIDFFDPESRTWRRMIEYKFWVL